MTEPRSTPGRKDRTSGRRAPLPTIGWREWVTLPGLSPTPIKAKIDTGARTSSLHAFALQVEAGSNGSPVAAFEIHPVQRSSEGAVRVEAPVVEFRRVRSSNGQTEVRPVIRAPLILGPHEFEVDVTLTSRDEMGFRMLLGRSAVRRRFLVDPGRSYRVSERR